MRSGAGVGQRSRNKVVQNTFKNTAEYELDTFCDIISYLSPGLFGDRENSWTCIYQFRERNDGKQVLKLLSSNFGLGLISYGMPITEADLDSYHKGDVCSELDLEVGS